MNKCLSRFLSIAAGVGLVAASASAQLLNVPFGDPVSELVRADNSTVSYDSGSQAFAVQGFPATVNSPSFGLYTNGNLTLNIQVANDGSLAGGVAGDDLVITGSVDVNGDFVPDYSGTLITGEVIGFGYEDGGPNLAFFDFRVQITGGAMAAEFPGQDLAIKLNVENAASFSGVFTSAFSGNFVKGFFGGTPQVCVDITKEVALAPFTDWKDANAAGDADVPNAAVGDAVKYRLTGTNCGSVDLVNLTFNDPTLGVVNHPVASLAAGQSVVLTDVEVAELSMPNRCATAGTKTNSASVDADSADTNESVTDSDTAVVECVAQPAIDLRKEISVDAGATWQDANTAATAPSVNAPHGAEYRFVIENTGTVLLPVVILNDPTLGVLGYNVGAMAPGQIVTLTKGEVPAADAPSRCATPGEYVNTASVNGINPTDPQNPVTDSDAAVLVCTNGGTPGIELIKEISVDGGAFVDANNVGDADVPQTLFPSDAVYRFTVRNTGDVALNNVKVNDPTLGITDYLIPTLAVGETKILTQADITALFAANRCTNSGTFTNVASVDAESSVDPTDTVSDSDPAVMECVGEPGVKIVKEISVDGVNWFDAQDAASAPTTTFPSDAEYRFVVSNVGTSPLVNVVVNDADIGVANYVVGNLAVGASVTIDSGALPGLVVADRCTNSGTFTNVVRVDADSSETGEATTDTDPAVLVCIGQPNIELVKEISVDGGTTWHDANNSGDADVPTVPFPHGADYRLTARNTGTIDLTNIVVNDTSLGVVDVNIAGTIPVGGQVVIGSGDIAALSVAQRCNGSGEIVNVAQVAADAVDTGTTVNATDPAILNCVGTPHITLLKQVSLDNANWADADAVGDADVPHALIPADAFYRFIVRNDGTSPLTNVVVNDTALGVANYSVGDMAVGAEVVITSGQLPALEAAGRCSVPGAVTNVADVAGESTETGDQVTDSDPAVLVCDEPPSGVCEIDVDLSAAFSSNPPPVNCAECDGKITTLTLRYNGANSAYIVVQQKDGATVFSDNVAANSTFSFVGVDSKGTLGTEISILVDGSLATKIHTSCSQDVLPGMDFGPFTVTAGQSRNGGDLCPVGGVGDPTCADVTYTYTVTNNGDAADVLLEDDTYDLGLDIFALGAGQSQQFTNEVCVSAASTTNTATVTATLTGNGAVNCSDMADVTVYCYDKEVWVQHCTNSSSGGQQCSLVKETRKVCDDTPPPPPPPTCEDKPYWVQHCTNSSSGGQQCSLVKKWKKVCDGDTPPPPTCETKEYWEQQCTNSSSGGQQCSLVKKTKEVCDADLASWDDSKAIKPSTPQQKFGKKRYGKKKHGKKASWRGKSKRWKYRGWR